jgi:tetratricopeptide (TPR) repeat protein
VDTTPFPYIDALTWFARGLGAARSSDLAAANASLQALESSRKQLEQMNEGYWAEQVEIQRLEVDAWVRLAAGQKETALATMKSAVHSESGNEKSDITPGPLAPARELLGEMLLELNEPSTALAEFEAGLQTEPNRFRTLYGAATAARVGGKEDLSRKYFGELLKVCEKADQPGRPEIQEAKRALSAD